MRSSNNLNTPSVNFTGWEGNEGSFFPTLNIQRAGRFRQSIGLVGGTSVEMFVGFTGSTLNRDAIWEGPLENWTNMFFACSGRYKVSYRAGAKGSWVDILGWNNQQWGWVEQNGGVGLHSTYKAALRLGFAGTYDEPFGLLWRAFCHQV